MWQFTAIKESTSKLSKIKKLGSKQVFSAVRLCLETSQRSLLERKWGLQIYSEKMGFTDFIQRKSKLLQI